MVRPAESTTTRPIHVAADDEPAPEATPPPANAVAETVVEPGPVDPAAAEAAAAKAKADPIAQQHQLRIQAKLDKKVDPETATQLVRVGHKLSHQIYDNGSALAQRAAEAIQAATQLKGAGGIVTNGTITKEGNRFVYSPEPKDKLIVPSEEGGTRAFTIDKIEGDLRSFQTFFSGDHNFSFHVTESGLNDDLDVVSLKKGREHTVTVKGKVAYDGKQYDADIKYVGDERRNADSTGNEYTSTATYSGTVKGEGFELTVEERQQYQQVYAVQTEGLGGNAVSTTREINNRLRAGDDVYRWKGCRTQQTFRNGMASNTDREWSASGELYLNDDLLGTYRLGIQRDIVAFELDIGGSRSSLEQFKRR